MNSGPSQSPQMLSHFLLSRTCSRKMLLHLLRPVVHLAPPRTSAPTGWLCLCDPNLIGSLPSLGYHEACHENQPGWASHSSAEMSQGVHWGLVSVTMPSQGHGATKWNPWLLSCPDRTRGPTDRALSGLPQGGVGVWGIPRRSPR